MDAGPGRPGCLPLGRAHRAARPAVLRSAPVRAAVRLERVPGPAPEVHLSAVRGRRLRPRVLHLVAGAARYQRAGQHRGAGRCALVHVRWPRLPPRPDPAGRDAADRGRGLLDRAGAPHHLPRPGESGADGADHLGRVPARLAPVRRQPVVEGSGCRRGGRDQAGTPHFHPVPAADQEVRAAAVACAAFAATVAAGFVAAPADSARWWLGGLFFNGGRTGFVGWEGNQSPQALLTRLAGSVAGAEPVWLAAALVAAGSRTGLRGPAGPGRSPAARVAGLCADRTAGVPDQLGSPLGVDRPGSGRRRRLRRPGHARPGSPRTGWCGSWYHWGGISGARGPGPGRAGAPASAPAVPVRVPVAGARARAWARAWARA